MRNNLKLYVWENVLSDWTEGIAFALAENADEARKMICEKLTKDFHGARFEDEFEKEPKEINSEVCYYLLGGG